LAQPGDFHLTMPHRVLAAIAWRDGQYETAAEHARIAAELVRDQGDRYVQATSMRQLAVMIGGGGGELAAEILCIVGALVPEVRMSARDAAAGARLRAELLETLGADRFHELLERGRGASNATMYTTVNHALAKMREPF